MGALRDELLKAGLISKKQAKQARHAERVDRKKIGKEERERQQKIKDEQWRKQKEEKKKRSRELEKKRQDEREKQARSHRLRDLINQNLVSSNIYGNRRFYFVARDGKIPFLNVSEDAARRLENGEYIIVQWQKQDLEKFAIVRRQILPKLKELDPEVIRFCP